MATTAVFRHFRSIEQLDSSGPQLRLGDDIRLSTKSLPLYEVKSTLLQRVKAKDGLASKQKMCFARYG